MNTKKITVTYYRMQYNDIISNMFTKYAREKIYFLDENNKLYLTSQGIQVGDAVTITGGGGGGSTSSTIITLKNNEGTTSNMSVSKGTKVEISFNFSYFTCNFRFCFWCKLYK